MSYFFSSWWPNTLLRHLMLCVSLNCHMVTIIESTKYSMSFSLKQLLALVSFFIFVNCVVLEAFLVGELL